MLFLPVNDDLTVSDNTMSNHHLSELAPRYPGSWLYAGLAVLLNAGQVLADDTVGVLPEAPNAAICYRVTCYANQGGPDAAMYQFSIKGNTANRPFNVRMTASKGGESQTTVARQNGSGIPSPTVTFKKGPGVYDVRVDKVLREGQSSLQGTMSYLITAHCLAANGAHTGENIEKTPCDTPPPPPPPAPANYKNFSSSIGKFSTEKHWVLECASTKKGMETSQYKFQIKFASKNKPFNLALQVHKEGFPDQEVVATDSKTKQPSDWGVLEGGNGTYFLDVVKQAVDGGTTDGNVSFMVKHNCFAADGSATVLKKFKKLP